MTFHYTVDYKGYNWFNCLSFDVHKHGINAQNPDLALQISNSVKVTHRNTGGVRPHGDHSHDVPTHDDCTGQCW